MTKDIIATNEYGREQRVLKLNLMKQRPNAEGKPLSNPLLEYSISDNVGTMTLGSQNKTYS